MLQITPLHSIMLYIKPIDFRKGLNSLVMFCINQLNEELLNQKVFVFVNRSKTAIKVLMYDGQGYWLCTKRLSKGRFTHWPKSAEEVSCLTCQQVTILLYNGNPDGAEYQEQFRKLS